MLHQPWDSVEMNKQVFRRLKMNGGGWIVFENNKYHVRIGVCEKF